MANTKIDSKFYAALKRMESATLRAPVNSSAIRQDTNLVLAKVSSLLGYQDYLAQARSWKAARKTVPISFEREVQAQASQALSDGHALAAATLRLTNHLKQAGEL